MLSPAHCWLLALTRKFRVRFVSQILHLTRLQSHVHTGARWSLRQEPQEYFPESRCLILWEIALRGTSSQWMFIRNILDDSTKTITSKPSFCSFCVRTMEFVVFRCVLFCFNKPWKKMSLFLQLEILVKNYQVSIWIQTKCRLQPPLTLCSIKLRGKWSLKWTRFKQKL